MKELQFSTVEKKGIKLHRIALEDNEFNELDRARNILFRVLNHEELYDNLIESYVDAKSAMYELSIRSVSDYSSNYNKSHYNRNKLNRLYFNTLNLSKLYLDKHYREIKKENGTKKVKCFSFSITKTQDTLDSVQQQRRLISNSNQDYMLGCQLRNFVQHSSLPVTNYVSGVRFSNKSEQAFAVFHIPLDKERLIQGGIKKNMLVDYPNEIDLHKIMDGYIKAISEIYVENNRLIKDVVDSCVGIINSKKKFIEDNFSKLNYGIDVVDVDKEKRLFSLSLEWFSVVEYLQQKNLHTLNFENFKHNPYRY
ncbi:hypothetical protein [Photobacterium leiognathi]|uniref:hypothetical protein n=1 Tax=Photobacterium leiognathi TaxID=553611 RepID=UPI002981D510|nr:hypothetical protein [Photobacterium leiognathi]